MSLDQDLPDLLTDAAKGALPATKAGVQAAIGRRAKRRRQHRAIGSVAAGLLVAACITAAVAIARTDEGADAPVTDPGGPALPDVPAVGLEIEGFEQHVPRMGEHDPRIGERDLGAEPPRSVAVFRSGGSITDPFVTVSIQPPIDGEPVSPEKTVDTDLDGDRDPDVGGGSSDQGYWLWWRLADGSLVTFAGKWVDGQPNRWRLDYVRELLGPTLDLETMPSPDGLPERRIWTMPDPRGPVEAEVTYEADGGTRQITVTTTNQPGWFDLYQDAVAYPHDGGPGYEELDLGPSFLGSGRAVVLPEYFLLGPADTYALVETDTGLTIEISAYGVSREVLRDLIQDGAFVDLDPDSSSPPSATTTPAPPTTTAIHSTTTAVDATVGDTDLVDVRVDDLPDRDRVVFLFARQLPDTLDVQTAAVPAHGECVAPGLDAPAFVNVRIGLTNTVGEAGYPEVVGGHPGGIIRDVVATCGFEAFVDFTIELERAVEPVVTRDAENAVLIVDFPR